MRLVSWYYLQESKEGRKEGVFHPYLHLGLMTTPRGGGGGGAPYKVLPIKAYTLQVYKRVGISQVEVYEWVGKSVI